MKLLRGMDLPTLSAPGVLDPLVLKGEKPELFDRTACRRAEGDHDGQRLDRLTRDEVALYRFFSATGRLLYVGIASQPRRRFAAHAESAPWWPLWAWRSVSWCMTRQHAAAVEQAAIITERPVWNQMGVAPASRHDELTVAKRWAKSLMECEARPSRAELDEQFSSIARLEEAGRDVTELRVRHAEAVAQAGWWARGSHERAQLAFNGRRARAEERRELRLEIEAGYREWTYLPDPPEPDAEVADDPSVEDVAPAGPAKTPKSRAKSKKTQRGADYVRASKSRRSKTDPVV